MGFVDFDEWKDKMRNGRNKIFARSNGQYGFIKSDCENWKSWKSHSGN